MRSDSSKDGQDHARRPDSRIASEAQTSLRASISAKDRYMPTIDDQVTFLELFYRICCFQSLLTSYVLITKATSISLRRHSCDRLG